MENNAFVVTDITTVLSKKGSFVDFRRAVTAAAQTYNHHLKDDEYFEIAMSYFPDYDREIVWELTHSQNNGNSLHPSFEENYTKLKFQKDSGDAFNIENIIKNVDVKRFHYFRDYQRFINSALTYEQEIAMREKLRKNWVEKRNNVESGPMADALYEWADNVNDLISDGYDADALEEIYQYAIPMYRLFQEGLDKDKEA